MSHRRSVARRIALPLLVTVCQLAPAPVRAQTASTRASTRAGALATPERARIDRIFGPHDKPGVPGCALGVFRDGAIAYARGYGAADLERRVPMTLATLFDVGSPRNSSPPPV
jgi:CubicO group peptidase (beta-lactamase class C family)